MAIVKYTKPAIEIEGWQGDKLYVRAAQLIIVAGRPWEVYSREEDGTVNAHVTFSDKQEAIDWCVGVVDRDAP